MPNFFSPYQYPQFYQNQPMQQQQPVQPQIQPQIQNGGFLSAPNEEYARNYPVGLGNSVTFKDENAPYVYTKTMGFSQLESPKFEKYRLIKEDAIIPSNLSENNGSDGKGTNDTIDNLISEIEAVKTDIKAVKEKLKALSKPISKKTVKEEDEDDE